MNSTFYAVVIDWVEYEGTTTGGMVKIFSNAKKARTFYEENVAQDKVYSKEICNSIIKEDSDSYVSYEDGNYVGNHCSIYIKTIKGNLKEGLEVELS